jgi:Sulfotransferase family
MAATTPFGKIRLSDLANPVRSPEQQAAYDYAQANPVVFSEEVILSAACERTGLSDFGAEDFRPRLRAWVQAVNEDVELSGAGRAGVWSEMVRFASTRLLVEDLLRRHPDIAQTEITTPVVVAGLPRSGTTYLLQLLAADRNSRSLPYWEAVRPVARPFIENGVDKRHSLCAAEWARTDAMMPYIKSIHEFSPDHISEDVELTCIDFGSYYLEWLAKVDSWRDYCFARDQTSVYRYTRKMMQLLSWQRGPHRWVTKCPQHMENLLPVSTAMPGAVMVINHRDPVASIQSAITGVAYSARLTRTRVNMRQIAEYWIDRYERMLRACVRDRDTLPAEKSHDVYFHEFMGNPLGTLEAIYRKACIEFDAAVRQDLTSAIACHPRGQHGQLVYNLREDFGFEPAEIRERFDFYFKKFPVAIEVK